MDDVKKRLSSNWGSTLLGFLVVVILGVFLINVLHNNSDSENGDIDNLADTTMEKTEDGTPIKTRHIIVKGESLWSIAVKEYGSGYNWITIAKANNLKNADDIEEGQELIIPEATQILPETGTGENLAMNENEGDVAGEESMTEEETVAPNEVMTEESTEESNESQREEAPSPQVEENQGQSAPRAGGEYVVQPGDSLWKLAQKAYENGYKWTEIAQLNNLQNPDLIFVGAVLKLP